MKEKKQPPIKTAFVLLFLITGIALLCIIWILSIGPLHNSHSQSEQITADIYQNGVLLESISLNNITESYTFTVYGEENCQNEIEVRPGSIGILSASCPDKLCVHQGFIDSSLLPITCLPNRLVIQVRTGTPSSETMTPDIISY